MTRVLILGSIIAVVCGALLGFTVAYQLTPLAVLAALLGLAGTLLVVRAIPEPTAEPGAPVTLGGPLARPVEDDEPVDEPLPAPVQQLPVPTVAAVPDAA
ncbi:hypothetical protein GCM10027063_01580 [Promicromonospora xylanilytica]